MVRRMSTREARDNFADLLGSVYYTKEPVVVEKKGKPVAVVISPEQYASIEQVGEQFWATVDQIREQNRDKDPDEVLRDVTDIVEEVRQERYDKRQHEATRGH
jgi:prevent-host-death family protein